MIVYLILIRYPLVAGSCLIVFAVHIRAQDQLQQLKRMRELRTVSPVFGAAAYDRKVHPSISFFLVDLLGSDVVILEIMEPPVTDEILC